MICFIFGGDKQTYLKRQVELIRKNIIDVESIVFVTGPCTRSPISSASRDHVVPSVEGVAMLRIDAADCTPGIKQTRYRRLIEHLVDRYLGDDGKYGLMIHGDLFPVATMSKEILLTGGDDRSKHYMAAWSGGFAPKWTLTNKHWGGQSHILESVATTWGLHITKIGEHRMQFFEPGFLHLDDISTDSEETIESKLRAVDEWLIAQVAVEA